MLLVPRTNISYPSDCLSISYTQEGLFILIGENNETLLTLVNCTYPFAAYTIGPYVDI